MAARPTPPDGCQWASFVRNHDELTLDKLTDEERQEVFDAFGPDPSMQVFGRGLARRLPPMMGGDERRIRMIYSLLFALPGTPVLFYGEEIGMGEHPDVSGRQAVRTPMQWTADETGGFSSAPADQFPSPVVTGTFGPDNVNVADQLNDDGLAPELHPAAHPPLSQLSRAGVGQLRGASGNPTQRSWHCRPAGTMRP